MICDALPATRTARQRRQGVHGGAKNTTDIHGENNPHNVVKGRRAWPVRTSPQTPRPIYHKVACCFKLQPAATNFKFNEPEIDVKRSTGQ